MHKKPLIGFSIIAVVLLILGSLGNVVGYQTVQTSQHNLIKERNNKIKLLFQTILDLANNKEIQQIIHKSPMMNGQSLYTDAKLPKTITKQQLRKMYIFGLLLSKRISKSKIQSMIQTHQLITSEMQQEIDAVIANDAILKEEITQLVNTDCGCNSETTEWGFPIICTVLLVMMGLVLIPWMLIFVFFMVPPSALDEMFELLSFFLSPLLILYQRFNCPVPEGNDFPIISDISPANGEENVPHNLTKLSFRIYDHEGDLMSYKVTTNPYIGEGHGTLVPNGTYTIPVHGLQHSTKYTWKLYLYEGDTSGTPLGKTYTFTTAPIAPFISNPTPKHNAPYVPIFTSNVSFDLMDYQEDLMNWTVETQPNIGSGDANGVGDGRYTVAINGLEYEKQYTWFVNATDGTNWTRKTYVFTTTSEGLLVFEPIADTYVTDNDPDSKRWNNPEIRLSKKDGTIPSCWDSRGMVLFDLSDIPTGSMIISSNLSLYYYDYHNINPVDREITCHRILEYWDEKDVSFNTMPNSNPVECASTFVPGNFRWVDWNVTSEVDDFIKGGVENYGWMIRDYKDPVWQYSHHYYYQSNANNDHPPRLFVWFNPP
ncbi:MAG: DNRLRE domain-containing protein [Petrotogales bacterium]